MSRDFYELCYDQYKYEMSEAAGIYQKASLMLAVIPLLATIMVTLGRLDILNLCFTRIDVFLFYLSFVAASAALVVSVVFLFVCVCPRDYKTMANMDGWQKWREDYQRYLNESGEDAAKAESLDNAMFQNICPRLVEAQPTNAKINEKRRKAFKRSVQAAAVSLAVIGIQAVFSLILTLQGV